MNDEIIKIPTLEELITESESDIKADAFTVLLNQNPPVKWLKPHPTASKKNAEGKFVPCVYLPIERIEFLLKRLYKKTWVEVRSVQIIANSVVVTVRLYVVNRISRETEWNDGVGAVAIQTDKNAGAMDWNAAKSNGVQIAAPAAESYAIKDAAEKLGKFFGANLNRAEEISFDGLLKKEIDFEELKALWELKKQMAPANSFADWERIIEQKETKSYKKLFTHLKTL